MSTRCTKSKAVTYRWQLEENQHVMATKGKVVDAGTFETNATFSYASPQAMSGGEPLAIRHTRGKQTAQEKAEAYLKPRSLMDKAQWRKWRIDNLTRPPHDTGWRTRLSNGLGGYSHVLRVWVKV